MRKPISFCDSCLNIVPLQFVCPGTWLCDLTLERYEVREKKVSKKVGGLWNVDI